MTFSTSSCFAQAGVTPFGEAWNEHAKALLRERQRARMSLGIKFRKLIKPDLDSWMASSSALASLSQMDVSTGELLRDLETAHRQASSAVEQIDRLLATSDVGEMADVAEALRTLGGYSSIPCQVTVSDDLCWAESWDPHVLLMLAEEALENAQLHSGASQITISCEADYGRIALRIVDNGRGFEVEGAGEETLGLGLMHCCAASLGASLNIQSTPLHGTVIQCILLNQ